MTAKEFKELLHSGELEWDKNHNNFNGKCWMIDIGGESFALMLDYMYNQKCNWRFSVKTGFNPLVEGIESNFYTNTDTAKKAIIKHLKRQQKLIASILKKEENDIKVLSKKI